MALAARRGRLVADWVQKIPEAGTLMRRTFKSWSWTSVVDYLCIWEGFQKQKYQNTVSDVFSFSLFLPFSLYDEFSKRKERHFQICKKLWALRSVNWAWPGALKGDAKVLPRKSKAFLNKALFLTKITECLRVRTGSKQTSQLEHVFFFFF